MGKEIKRISFFEDLKEKKATIAYFLQEGPNTCNASCEGCYAGAGTSSEDMARGIIDPVEAREDISELVKEYRVLIRGTEILMNREYIPLLKLAENKVILTNGIILGRQPKILDYLAENGVSNITITYPFEDSTSSTRNLNNLSHQRPDILDAVKNITRHDHDFTLQLSAIVTREDVQSRSALENLCKEAIDLDADVLRMIPYVPISGNETIDRYALNIEERAKLASLTTELKSKYDKEELMIHTPGVLGLFPYRRALKREASDEKAICPAGLHYFAIGAAKKGDMRKITPCHFIMNEEVGAYGGGSKIQIYEHRICELFKNVDREDCFAQNYWKSLRQ